MYLVIGIIGALVGIVIAVIQMINERKGIESANVILNDLTSVEVTQKIKEKDAEYLIPLYMRTVTYFSELRKVKYNSQVIQSIIERLQYIESFIPIEYTKFNTTDNLGETYYEAKRKFLTKISQGHNISTYYDKFYSDHKEVQMQGGKELLKKCTILNDQKILDVGCGDGYFSFEMAKYSDVKIDAVDNANNLIEIAEKTKERDNITNITFYHADFKTFKKENYYDLIFSNFAIHWAGKYYKNWFQNIYDSLKVDGQLAASISGSKMNKENKMLTFYELSDGSDSVINKAIKKLNFNKYFKNKDTYEIHNYWAPTKEDLEKVLKILDLKISI
ncbi:hypothetical protein FACS1894172_16880 [Spirochaetia bacterium]|nr:hypothetical protein FACS1894164_20500 [Spirochaetia bacterium]GHU35286.1 hypothetical protein FACS1894172_16880 [Spirochaetia bacterium]